MDQFHQINHQIKLQIEERIAKSAIIQQNMEVVMQIDKIIKGRNLSAKSSDVDTSHEVVHRSCQKECAHKRHVRECIIYVDISKIWDEATLKGVNQRLTELSLDGLCLI